MDEYIVSDILYRHIKVVGPMGEFTRVHDALIAGNFRVTRSGPYTDAEMFPSCDDTRFLMEAHKKES